MKHYFNAEHKIFGQNDFKRSIANIIKHHAYFSPFRSPEHVENKI